MIARASERRRAFVWAVAVAALIAVDVLPARARAGWLGDEWRNFRSHPRMDQAHRLYREERFNDVLPLVEEVERIDPHNRGARLLHFQACARLDRRDCLKSVGQAWTALAPDDGLGPGMLAYLAYIEGRDRDLVPLVRTALEHPGLTPVQRTTAGRAWVNALLRLGRPGDAQAALAWLDEHQVSVKAEDRERWKARLAEAKAPPPPATASPPAAAKPPARARRPQAKPTQEEPEAETETGAEAEAAESVFPYPDLPPPEQGRRWLEDVQALTDDHRDADAAALLDDLHRRGQPAPEATAQFVATEAYRLKAEGQIEPARAQFVQALRLDPVRVELLPEIAYLEQLLGRRQDSIDHQRQAIDHAAAIQTRLHQDDDEAARQLYAWRRTVQYQEDRFGFVLPVVVRLNSSATPQQPVSPLTYSQYSGFLGLDASYRFAPLSPQYPSWVIARVTQQLQDPGLRPQEGNLLAGGGVRQRLLEHHVLLGSVEYIFRSNAAKENDVMLRVSGSQSWGGDWQPVGPGWVYANLFADFAWLVRSASYFTTVAAEGGWHYRVPGMPFKATLLPYGAATFTANNGDSPHATVTRFDLGGGLAVQTWHRADKYRAPSFTQRLAVEVRQTYAGNTTDRFAVQLRWILFH